MGVKENYCAVGRPRCICACPRRFRFVFRQGAKCVLNERFNLVLDCCNSKVMAKISDLCLSGIRSFGPFDEDRQRIKYSTPLTIILGPNGCGKTSIIEALKFACSGDVPEGSQRGQGFVNDPKINGMFRTKGQVRLRLRDAKGTEYVICKSVEVVQKSSALQFSRPDSTLTIKKDGEERHISGKCADIDEQCREILGVSAPIINNVIFCHQENSSWPLEDGKKLKEKFDEIFDSTMYNKCIETILKQIKTGKEELKLTRAQLEARKVKKLEVERNLAKLLENQEKLHNLGKDVTEKNKQLEPVLLRMAEINKLQSSYNEVREKLAVHENEKKNLQEQQKLILKNIISEFEGSDEDLKEELNTFDTNQGRIKQRKADLERKTEDIEKEDKKVSADIKKRQEKVGELREACRQFEKLQVERNTLIENVKKDLELSVSTDLDSIEDVDKMIGDIKEVLELSCASLDELKQQFDEEEAAKQRVIDEKNKQLTEVQQTQKLKEDQIRENDKKLRTINGELQALKYTSQRLQNVEDKIKNIEANLKSLDATNDVQKYQSEIEAEKKKITELEEQQDILNKEYKILEKNNTVESDIDTQRSEIHKCETDILKMKSKNFDNFKQLFSDEVPEDGLKDAVKSLLVLKQNIYDELTSKIQRKDREFAALETKLISEREKLRQYTTELTTAKNEIAGLCKEKPFEQVVEETKTLIEKLQKEKGQLSSAKIIYEKFVADFQKEKPCCPICQTNFSNKVDSTKEIIATIKAKIKGIPNELAKVEKELKQNEALYTKLLQKKSTNEEIKILSQQKIPKVEQIVQGLEKEKQGVKEQLTDYKEQLIEPKSKLEICRNVVTDAALIDQCLSSIRRSKTKIESLERQLLTVPSNRSKPQTELELENVIEDIKTSRQKLEAIQRKLDQFKSRRAELIEQKSKFAEQRSDMQKEIQNKPQLETQLTEVTDKNAELKNELLELQKRIAPIELELREAKKEKERTKANHRQVCDAEQRKLVKREKVLRDIEGLQSKIKDCLKQGVEEQLEKETKQLNECTETRNALVEAKNKVMTTIAEINIQLQKEQNLLTSLKSNIELRAKRKLERTLNSEIQEIKQQMGNLDYQGVEEEREKLARQIQTVNNTIQKLEGQKTELQDQIKSMEAELRKPENSEAEKQFKHKYFELIVSEQALVDLDDYCKVIQKAVIEYHKSCMKKINTSIRQLWRSIYRGNDIDWIEIKTEEGDQKGLKRSYNYKVTIIIFFAIPA